MAALSNSGLDPLESQFRHRVSQFVVREGLSIEVEPVKGSFDMAPSLDVVKAIGTAIQHEGPVYEPKAVVEVAPKAPTQDKPELDLTGF